MTIEELAARGIRIASGLNWEVTVCQGEDPDSDWIAWFRVGVQFFQLARGEADAESRNHCEFVAEQFVKALDAMRRTS